MNNTLYLSIFIKYIFLEFTFVKLFKLLIFLFILIKLFFIHRKNFIADPHMGDHVPDDYLYQGNFIF